MQLVYSILTLMLMGREGEHKFPLATQATHYAVVWSGTWDASVTKLDSLYQRQP